MNTKFSALAAVATIAFCLSCNNSSTIDEWQPSPVAPGNIQGSGTPATETRVLPAFEEIVLLATGDINVTQGAPQSVSVRVDNNVMPYIETVHSGSQLEIRTRSGVTLANYDLTVNVVMTDVSLLHMAGVGSIVGQNTLMVDRLDLNLSGVGSMSLVCIAESLFTSHGAVGDLVLSRAADLHSIALGGVGNVTAFGLATDLTTVVLVGQGNAEVRVLDSLDVIIAGTGSVLYHGTPIVTSVITGTGAVVDAN